jgi:peptidyl-prolyl cis-trans isomerase D
MKIVFGAIILSFCLWGLGDIIHNYTASRSVLTIDDSKMTVDQFLMEYGQEKQRVRNSGAKPLTDDELQKIDIKGLVLEKFTQINVIRQTMNKLNIIVPKKSLFDIVRSLPEFQNNGTFDPKIYEMTIKRSGISEATFLDQVRESVARSQLFHPITAGYKLPNFVKNIIAKEFESKNTVIVARLNINSMKYDEVPDNETLKQFYLNNPDKYRQPEIRDIAVLVIDYGKLAGDITVSDEEVDARYEETKDAYIAKEKRDFERFAFENSEYASKAWQMLVKGAKTAEIVKKFIPKVDMIKQCDASDFSTQIGSELFDLKPNGSSQVHQIGGVYYVYKLVRIDKPKQLSEAEIKAAIRKELQGEKMNSPEFYAKTKDMRNKIDDSFGAGRSIEEIAKETDMNIVEIKGLKNSQDNPDLTKLVTDEDTRNEVLETVFSTDELQPSQMIVSRATDTLAYVVFVQKVEQATIPGFKKISKQVSEDYIFEMKGKLASDKINDIMGKGSETAKEIAAMSGAKKFKFSKMDLITNSKDHKAEVDGILEEIPNANIVLEIISTLKKGWANYYRLSDKEYIFIAINDIEKVENASPDIEQNISRYLDSNTDRDVEAVSYEAFKSKSKIVIDRERLDEVTKVSDEHEEH